MLEGMGIDTGVNLDKLIECVWMCVETLEQATHFTRGPEVYEGAIYPWKEPITSPYRDRVEQGLPPFEVDGDWPRNEDFFPKPSAIHGPDQP